MICSALCGNALCVMCLCVWQIMQYCSQACAAAGNKVHGPNCWCAVMRVLTGLHNMLYFVFWLSLYVCRTCMLLDCSQKLVIADICAMQTVGAACMLLLKVLLHCMSSQFQCI
jgi:hypothetical protein